MNRNIARKRGLRKVKARKKQNWNAKLESGQIRITGEHFTGGILYGRWGDGELFELGRIQEMPKIEVYSGGDILDSEIIGENE